MKKGQNRKKKFQRKQAIICAGIFVLLASAAGGAFLYVQKSKDKQAPKIKASQVTVSRGEVSNKIVATGNLEREAAVSQKLPSGITVEKVYVESGDTVDKGEVLAVASYLSVLTAISETQESIDSLEEQITKYEEGEDEESTELEYEIMLAKKEALEVTMQKLQILQEDRKIKSERAGIVQSVYVSDGNNETSSDASSGGNMTATAMSYMSFPSGDFEGIETEISENEETPVETVTAEELGQYLTPDSEEGSAQTKLQFSIAASGTSCAQELILETPKTGNIPQTQIVASDGVYSGTVMWNMDQETFQNGIVYQARVTLNAQDGYYFSADSIQQLSVGILSGISVGEEGKRLSFQITFPETESKESSETMDVHREETESADENASGGVEIQKEESEQEEEGNFVSKNENEAQQSSVDLVQGQSTQALSASTESDSSESSRNDTEISVGMQYSTDTTAFLISGNEKMILSVNVDELDINSVSEGQNAQITFDAIEDETFAGTVTSIDQEASAGNGVAKYGVEITLDRQNQMKVGMNASATIVIEEKKDVLTIPVNALQERGREVFVYTEQDENGNLTGERSVTTGLSDGETVEITEGLSEGETVYYQKTGNTSSNNGQQEMPRGEMQFPGNEDAGMGVRGNFPKQGNMNGAQGGPPSM